METVQPLKYCLYARKSSESDERQAKIEKHYAITKTLLDHYKVKTELTKPIIEYARYVLTRGTFAEQHGLAKSIKQTLQLKDSIISLNK